MLLSVLNTFFVFCHPERINEVKQEMIRFAQDHPGDKERIRAEAIKRLEDIVDKLPLRKSLLGGLVVSGSGVVDCGDVVVRGDVAKIKKRLG